MKKWLIQYISLLLLRDLWDISYITEFKKVLHLCLHFKVVTRLIEQKIEHFKFEVFRIQVSNVLCAAASFYVCIFLYMHKYI